MYEKGCDEQLICKKTGHRSVAVRSYKRTSNRQLKQVTDILYGNSANKTEKKECEVKVPKNEASSTVSVPPKDEGTNDENEEILSGIIEGECQGVQIAKGVTLNININVSK